MRAARYLGVPIWELYERPLYWQEWANLAESAENEAEAERAKREQ